MNYPARLDTKSGNCTEASRLKILDCGRRFQGNFDCLEVSTKLKHWKKIITFTLRLDRYLTFNTLIHRYHRQAGLSRATLKISSKFFL